MDCGRARAAELSLASSTVWRILPQGFSNHPYRGLLDEQYARYPLLHAGFINGEIHARPARAMKAEPPSGQLAGRSCPSMRRPRRRGRFSVWSEEARDQVNTGPNGDRSATTGDAHEILVPAAVRLGTGERDSDMDRAAAADGVARVEMRLVITCSSYRGLPMKGTDGQRAAESDG
jgi:hypothetical protein